MAAASPYRLRVEGMDCASCALKIETVMQRLPGVSDIHVSYANETLALQLDEDRTALGTIEQKIRALGYTPVIEQTEAKRGSPGLPRSHRACKLDPLTSTLHVRLLQQRSSISASKTKPVSA